MAKPESLLPVSASCRSQDPVLIIIPLVTTRTNCYAYMAIRTATMTACLKPDAMKVGLRGEEQD
jgi:hypothetical protein